MNALRQDRDQRLLRDLHEGKNICSCIPEQDTPPCPSTLNVHHWWRKHFLQRVWQMNNKQQRQSKLFCATEKEAKINNKKAHHFILSSFLSWATHRKLSKYITQFAFSLAAAPAFPTSTTISQSVYCLLQVHLRLGPNETDPCSFPFSMVLFLRRSFGQSSGTSGANLMVILNKR